MIIVRDGKEIELTADEVRQAYYECQLKWDVECILGITETMMESEDGELAELAERFQNDRDYAKRVALEYRSYMNEYPGGDTEWDCVVDALEKEAEE